MKYRRFGQNSERSGYIHIILIAVIVAILILGCYATIHFTNQRDLTDKDSQKADIAMREVSTTVYAQAEQEYSENEEIQETIVSTESDPNEQYYQGYHSYIEQRLRISPSPDTQFYSLYDINGDGIPELLPGGKITLYEIIALKDGEIYEYADFTYLRTGFLCFEICENDVLKLKDYESDTWFFLKANADRMVFLQGLRHENNDWYLLIEPPVAANADWTKEKISETNAQEIMNSYIPLGTQPARQLMSRYGQPVTYSWKDPYALYIAQSLEQSEKSVPYTYALVDLNNDGTQELIANDIYAIPSGATDTVPELSIHTIVDGKIVAVTTLNTPITNICENGMLMYSDIDGTYYEFYRMDDAKLQLVEKVIQDKTDHSWNYVCASSNELLKRITEEEATQIINAYKPIELTMKPFSEYPFS